jgi:hypothetical protein
MRLGLYGETLELYHNESNAVKWTDTAPGTEVLGVTWLRAIFAIPAEFDPFSRSEALLLDAEGLGRGRAWVNGHDLGLYWDIARNDASRDPTQRYYYVPKEWFVRGENTVVFAEVGGTSALNAGLAIASMESVSEKESEEAVAAVTGGRQRSCAF